MSFIDHICHSIHSTVRLSGPQRRRRHCVSDDASRPGWGPMGSAPLLLQQRASGGVQTARRPLELWLVVSSDSMEWMPPAFLLTMQLSPQVRKISGAGAGAGVGMGCTGSVVVTQSSSLVCSL